MMGRTIQDVITATVHRYGMHDVLVDPEVKVTRTLLSIAVALATHEANIDGERMLVVGTYRLERQGLDWFLRGSSATSYPVDQPLPLFQAGGGASGNNRDPNALAESSGLVNDPAVHEVAVTLSDGTREITPVENGAFLYAKAGTMRPLGVEALDAQGNVLHQETFDK